MYIFSNIAFYTGSMEGVLRRIQTWIRNKQHTYVCVTGVHGVVESVHNNRVLLAHQKAGLVVPDGMPLVWIGKMSGRPDIERIYGPDLFLAVCRCAEVKRWKLFLFGTTPQTLQRLKVRLHTRFPRLIVAGCFAPPFRPSTQQEDADVIQKINATKAQVVVVGLSTPKQELWMHRHVEKLYANVLIGVGAAFDFIAGTKKQAPPWVQHIGMEWLYRLVNEPRRLGKRYLANMVQLIGLIIRSLILPKNED